MEDIDSAIEVIRQLKEIGVGIKIDDFGTGYSSLNYVHRLPVDTLKIDRSFVSTMMQSGENREIVRTIVAMAKNLHKELVAEGIESQEQANQLRALGCDYGQGYYYAPALDARGAEAYLMERGVLEMTLETQAVV
jgi:EAL domain-containing protein (putative c-di-GMP-specific phosphodiesterase class I)